MTKIEDIIDTNLLFKEIEAGYIRVRRHPEFPELEIYNYTETVQFEKHWNDATRLCRGLIVNADTGDVLARPFGKFHNWDEPEAPPIKSDQLVYHWADKADGSLGIGYVRPDGKAAIATRGSFESEQALHATANLSPQDEANILGNWDILNSTLLYEIVYPENRIVIDYGGADELIYLGSIDIASGMYIPPLTDRRRSFHDLLMDTSRPNSEGWVVWLSAYKAVKVKQADYVELHRIVTGLNRKSIWRAIKDNTYADLIGQLPDELYKWAGTVNEEIAAQYEFIDGAARAAYAACGTTAGSQKEFALLVQSEITDTTIRGLVFSLRNGKPIRDAIYKMIEPKGGDR